MNISLSIGQRLGLGFFLISLLVLFASGIGWIYSESVEDTVSTTRDGFDHVQSVADLERSWLTIAATIDNMLLTRQASLLDQRLAQELDNFTQQLEILQTERLASDDTIAAENHRIAEDLQLLGDELTAQVDELSSMVREDRWAQAQILRHTDIASLQRRFDNGLSELNANIQTDVDSSVDESAQIQRANQTFLIYAAIVAVVASIGAGFLTARSVTRPVATLVNTTEAIQAGDLTRRATIKGQDEIATLAQSFNSMADQLNNLIDHLEERVNDRTRDLQTAADVSRQITTVLEIDKLLEEVMILTGKSFDLYATVVLVFDEEKQHLSSAIGAAVEGRIIKDKQQDIPLSADPSIIALAARKREAVNVPNVEKSPLYLPNPQFPETHSELAIPMTLGTQLVGVFDLKSKSTGRFSEEDVRVLTSLAEQVAVAIRNAQLFAEAREARQAAEVANQVKSYFLAAMSHELRTPLNGIVNFTRLVADGLMGPVNDKQVEVLKKAVANSRHLLALINDVLDISKIESKSLKLFVETDVNVNEELQAVIANAEALIEDKPVELVAQMDTDLPPILGDKRRIRQILLNLVSNACKFTNSGQITVSSTHKNGEIQLVVKDTGPGIPAKDLEAIFESFRQSSEGLRKGGGTGLGLPISRRLAEAHGGQLWVESVVGEGSIFYVTLPMQPPHLEPTLVEEQGAK